MNAAAAREIQLGGGRVNPPRAAATAVGGGGGVGPPPLGRLPYMALMRRSPHSPPQTSRFLFFSFKGPRILASDPGCP